MAATDTGPMNAAHRALDEQRDYILIRTGGVLRAFVAPAVPPDVDTIDVKVVPQIEDGGYYAMPGGAVGKHPGSIRSYAIHVDAVSTNWTEAYIIADVP